VSNEQTLPPLPELPVVSAELSQAHWGPALWFTRNEVDGVSMNQPRKGEYGMKDYGPMFTVRQVHAYASAYAAEAVRNALARQAAPEAKGKMELVRSLLWDTFPVCCGNYQNDQNSYDPVCCGCPDGDTLADADIVTQLRAAFPDVAPQDVVAPQPVYGELLAMGADCADTLLAIGRKIGFGRAQQILGEQWDAEHGCAPRGRMGVTVKDAAPQAPALTDERITDIIRSVAELPDRNSPEDWPEAMLVTADELRALLAAASPIPTEEPTDRGYSEMSRESLERHAMRMAEALSDDAPRKFFERHAMGPKRAPSCLCCGEVPEQIAVQHMELPGIVVCAKCRFPAQGGSPTPTPTPTEED
jgi:hypothetical protein